MLAVADFVEATSLPLGRTKILEVAKAPAACTLDFPNGIPFATLTSAFCGHFAYTVDWACVRFVSGHLAPRRALAARL